MPEKEIKSKLHLCSNQCGETCDCGNSKEKCTYCSNCTEDVPDISQCDYCLNRATLACESCEELFVCVDHEDAQPGGCDQCKDEMESEDDEDQEEEDEEE